MTTFESYRDATAYLQASQRPLFVLLKSIDPDALGSTLALARALKLANKEPHIVTQGSIPQSMRFLLTGDIPYQENVTMFPAVFDSIIVADSGHSDRTGFTKEIIEAREHGIPVINIDHHHNHDDFGTVNVIDVKASATAEVTYDLIKLGDWPIDAQVATAILAGIIEDTGNFTNAGTTVRSLEIAAHCYAKGADARRITRELYQGREFNALRLWGTILSRLKKHEQWGLVSTVILREDFETYDISDEATEGLSNFMNNITEARASLVLKELPTGEVRGSLRTTRDDVDVSKIANLFGGGGHKKAAGFTIPGKIVKADGGWRVVAA